MQTKFPAEIFGEAPLPSDENDIYHQAWHVLVQVRTLLEMNGKMGYFSEELDGQLRRTAQSLEHLFPCPEEEPDIAF